MGYLDGEDAKKPGKKGHEADHTTLLGQYRNPVFAVLAGVYSRQRRWERDCHISVTASIEVLAAEVTVVRSWSRWRSQGYDISLVGVVLLEILTVFRVVHSTVCIVDSDLMQACMISITCWKRGGSDNATLAG